MKKTIYFLLGVLLSSLVVILAGCDSKALEIDTIITPTFTSIGGKLAVEYKLGDLLILDEWEDLNVAQIVFLATGDELKSVHLKATAGDFNGVTFKYSIGNIDVETKPIKFTTLERNSDSIPGLTWTMGEKKVKEVEKDEPIKKKGLTKKKL